MQFWNQPIREVFSEVKTSEKGLTTQQAEERLKQYGSNEIRNGKENTVLKILWSQISNPLILILMIVVGISFFTGDHVNAVVILVMLLINIVLGFSQEYKAKRSLDRLQKLIKIRVKTLRDGKITTIDSQDIVPGDVVLLNKGDYIPADIRLFQTNNLSVNESALTGESVEISKNSRIDTTGDQPQDIKNGVFQGCFVSEGNARGVVVSTAKNTFLGKSVQVANKSDQQTNFVKKLNQFTKILFIFVAIITTTSFIINISLGRDILSSFVLGITLALGITPETMPVILTLSLSNAAYQLSTKKLLIKRLTVFEDLGNLDIVCTDKTGTITKGILKPAHYFDVDFNESSEVKNMSLVCNANNPGINYQIMPNSIDDVLADHTHWDKVQNFSKLIKVWDFDFNTRMMGIQAMFNTEKLVIKGAYEAIISKSDLSKSKQEELIASLEEYEQKGYRIIGIATKDIKKEIDSLDDIADFKVLGFVLLIDEPRDNMEKEFNRLKRLQVSLKIITGDSAAITREICRKVGLDINEDRVITGEELEGLETDKFAEIANRYNVFARVSPSQKLSIIESLKASDHVVGYIGDGINDVGALKIADVSISVDSGVDVAKDCSDIIILEKELNTVAQGVIEGRKVFANTMKFIFGTMSSSFGNVITITFASLFLKFLPLLPAQVILLDSITDFQHLAISTDNVDKELISKPRNWDMGVFSEFAIFWGLISTVFDFVLIYIMATVTSSPELFRTTWMLESVFTELVSTISIRTHNWFFRSKPSKALLVFSVIPILMIVFLAYTKFGETIFGFAAPHIWLIILVVVVVMFYLLAMEIAKRRYFRRFWGVKY